MLDRNAMRCIGPEVVEAEIKVLGSWTPFMIRSNFDCTTVIFKHFALYQCFCFIHWKALFFYTATETYPKLVFFTLKKLRVFSP